MFSHGYIKNDFDVTRGGAGIPGAAAVEVLKEEWQRRSWSKLPQARARVEGTRLG